MKNKKMIITIAAVVLVIIVGVIAFVLINNNGKETDKKAITEKEIIKEEKFGGLEFKNTTFIKEKDLYTLSIDVTNPSKKDIDMEQVKIILKDKKGNEIITLKGYIGDPIKANETRTITASTRADLSKAKSKTIEAY